MCRLVPPPIFDFLGRSLQSSSRGASPRIVSNWLPPFLEITTQSRRCQLLPPRHHGSSRDSLHGKSEPMGARLVRQFGSREAVHRDSKVQRGGTSRWSGGKSGNPRLIERLQKCCTHQRRSSYAFAREHTNLAAPSDAPALCTDRLLIVWTARDYWLRLSGPLPGE